MKFAFYPGCSLLSSGREYYESFMLISKALDIELVELPDWSCCGTHASYIFNKKFAVSLASRNLAIAESLSLDLMTPCSGCYQSLSKASSLLEDPKLRDEVNNVLSDMGLKYEGKIKIRHALDVIVNDIGINKISEKVSRPLKGLKVAPYYGCATIRPQYPNSFSDPYNPQSLEQLIVALGAESVSYPDKTRCCGGNLIMRKEAVAFEMIKKLLLNAKALGSHCIITPCPLCHMALDVMQTRIESAFKIKIDLPILYFTQLIGLAYGIEPKKLELNRHAVSPMKLLTLTQT
ncbi:MAG: CoB--CoM heterodisulfide reductase iron-sulfur subunit B family protein [Candidatus Bathyarchaeota archaeon]